MSSPSKSVERVRRGDAHDAFAGAAQGQHGMGLGEGDGQALEQLHVDVVGAELAPHGQAELCAERLLHLFLVEEAEREDVIGETTALRLLAAHGFLELRGREARRAQQHFAQAEVLE
jgi:hypothetical protein